MAKAEKGLWHYVKNAFNLRMKVKGLGGVPVNWLALGGVAVLGVLSPGFLAIGAGVELAYLAVMAHNGRFRKVVDGQDLLKSNADWDRQMRERAVRLSPEGAERFAELRHRCDRLGLGPEGDAADPMASLRRGSLNRLLWIYLRLLQSMEALDRQIDSGARHQVESELGMQEKKLKDMPAAPDDPLRKSVEATIEILKRRLDNLTAVSGKMKFIDSELTRIEQQVELIIEESALSKDGAHLSARIDTVASTLEETNAWMAANADVLGATADEAEPPPIAPQVAQKA